MERMTKDSVIRGEARPYLQSYESTILPTGSYEGAIDGAFAAWYNEHDQILAVSHAWAAEDETGHKAEVEITPDTLFLVHEPGYGYGSPVKENGEIVEAPPENKPVEDEEPPEAPETEKKAPQPKSKKKADDTDPASEDDSKP